MKTSRSIVTGSGISMLVETNRAGEDVEVTFRAPPGKACLLHWGIRRSPSEGWTAPPPSLWPPRTQGAGSTAVQTAFSSSDGETTLVIRVRQPSIQAVLEFVLYFPDERQWDNNGGRNYRVPLAEPEPAGPNPLSVLRAQIGTEELSFERVFDLEEVGQLAVAATKAAGGFRVYLCHNLRDKWLLHWGIARRSPHEWLPPAERGLPPGTSIIDQRAAQTPFMAREGLGWLCLEFDTAEAPLGIQFVLRQVDRSARWLNYRGGNFFVPVHSALPAFHGAGLEAVRNIADEIVRAETTRGSWTLMHRFNLCHELLDRVRNDLEGLALLYVWLRFSSIRQLTWQRNYNTKPRELAHAQGCLTQKLADMHRAEPACRPVLRLMLATVGPGGEGQRIRDEILNIMHRHHIKEVSGHFLEEWHQKLHNNTTPDDIVICEAYLEFLRTQGSRDRFYQVLQAGGVSRQRLESFERPIRSQPDFVPHLKDALIRDFEHFLRILRAAHSGTDFETALNATRGRLDGELRGLVDWIGAHRGEDADRLLYLVTQITEVRRRLSHLLQHGESVRDLLYLDLALEQLLRAAVERNIHLRQGGDPLSDLIARVLENITFSFEDPELAACSRHWQRLQTIPRFGSEWSLHAKSVADRTARVLGARIDHFYQLLQPKAEYLGRGFQAEQWTITLFSEEVVRGSSLGFVLSMLLHQLDPLLRHAARLSAWQIISRGSGAGRLEVVDSLRSLQQRKFANPVVVIADKVAGDEEIPEGVTAVIVPDVIDVVSHVAVRARNSQVLFAACHDAGLLERLKALRGHDLRLEVTGAGDVLVQEAGSAASASPRTNIPPVRLTPRHFTKYAVSPDEFDAHTVGGKSLRQASLRGKLPGWVALPSSVAVPFGVFDRTLTLDANREVAQRYAALAREAQRGQAATWAALRETVLALIAPPELEPALQEVMTRSGVPSASDWAKAWTCIRRVWASKWNDRACLSRQKMGIPHDALSMAVLIQQVVPADYSFVIHTLNPANGDATQLYAEMVLGLGDTLVGNYPGRALSFTGTKDSAEMNLLSFPSKSIALYGGGLIFRSDSNGEDLAGYAGAGLYDSVFLEPPRQATLDYAQERLVWDEPFRTNMLATITRLGAAVERVCGTPQDIEGAVTEGRFFLVQTRPQAGTELEQSKRDSPQGCSNTTACQNP